MWAGFFACFVLTFGRSDISLPDAEGGRGFGVLRLPGDGSLDLPGDGVCNPPCVVLGNCKASGWWDNESVSAKDDLELSFLCPVDR